jgi:hypothetical protein
MPRYEITDTHLIVHLNLLDRIKTLRKSFAVSKENIRGATEDQGVIPGELGIRAPGTGLPHVVYAGTFFKRFERQFVSWHRGESAVVVELKDHKFARLILGSKEPRELVRQINSLVH